MSTTRNNDHPGRYGSIVFQCDGLHCDEEFDTGYTTWDYAKSSMKQEGWYIMKDTLGDWCHYCKPCGKERWIQEKKAEERKAILDLETKKKG